MQCDECGKQIDRQPIRSDFFFAQCESCERESSGFLSLADMIDQAESQLDNR